MSRRAALQLGAGAGIAAAAAPYIARIDQGGAVDLSTVRPAGAANPGYPAPAMVTRAQWGANEALRKGGQEFDARVVKLIVHHTGTPNSITNYPALCRGILSSETAGEYIDVAYNWLIDPNGRIYEGRWAQNYPSGAPHTGERNGKNVRGGHALYHNTATIGIALMGNYELIPPSAAMINGLVNLLTWKCARWGLNPAARGLYRASNGWNHDIFNICGHRDTGSTACPGHHVHSMLPTIRSRVQSRLSSGGYWVASAAGQVFSYGGAAYRGAVTASSATGPVTGMCGHPAGAGYWLHTADGHVFPFGTGYYGGTNGRRLSAPIVGMAATPSGRGYWLLGRDGGVFCFGDARYFGSTGNRRLNAPVLGITPTPSGKGYWLYARDGGIFSFGDARFFGSTGNLRLNRPVVSMAARPQGDGYWMIAEDGGVFSFGRAPFRGSWAGSGLRSPCIDMLATTTGNGYVMLRGDGSVGNFGDAPNLGGPGRGARGGAVGIAGRLKPF